MLAVLFVGIGLLNWLEYLHQKKRISGELARKTVHIYSGLAVILCVFLLPVRWVVLFELCNIAAMILVRHFKLFKSQYSINRLSWGEFLFVLGVIVLLVWGVPRWVFVVAVLHLSLADAAAALIGTWYGSKTGYKILGHQKSLAGSLAFFTTSVVIITCTIWLVPQAIVLAPIWAIAAIPAATTLAENVGILGLDNLLIPLVVAAFLAR